MEVCNVCGGNDFDQHDGLYYCNECNTKLQSKQRQEEEDEWHENLFTRLGIAGSAKKTETKKAEKTVQLGEQWGTHQCFNIIICKQVEKLIQLGVSPQLKFVVFSLWAKYLKKCEVAFVGNKEDKDWLPRLGTVPLARDVIILYGGERKLPNRYNKRKRKLSEVENPEEIVVESEIESTKKLPKSKEETKESPTNGMKTNVARSLEFSKEAQEKQTKSTRKITKAKRLNNYNDYMSIEKTAAFCYLGLLLTEPNILLCDLIRWAREDHFPYVGVSYLLPSSMKLQSHDWRFITAYKIPEHGKINDLTNKLAVFLDVDNLPERPLMPIVARFVIDLNLPYEMLPIINKLIDGKVSFTHRKNEGIPKYELMAMSLIIITLKLLFGLNNDIERKLSTVGRQLKEHLPKGSQPFIWEDWVEHTTFKLNFISHAHAPSGIFAENDIFNVDSHKTFYEQAIYNHWRPKETSLAKHCNKTEFRVALRKVFSDMNNTEETAAICPVTSFPLSSWTKYYKNTNIPHSTLYSENFSCCTLTHITKWKKYMDEDAKVRDIYNCHFQGIFCSNDNVSEDDLDILACNQYWVLHTTKNNPLDIPYKSFMWLLSICSKYVEVSTDELYTEMLKMENAVLNCSRLQKHLPQNNTKIKEASLVRRSINRRKQKK